MKFPGSSSSDRGIGAWVRWSVSQKGVVAFFVLAVVALGVFGIKRMSKDEFPTFEIKQGLVAGVYPGATASQVEAQLTKPLEEYLFTFKEIHRASLHSVSKEGICYIYVDLEEKVPQSRKDEVWSKIKLGLQARKLTLPTGVIAIAVLDDFSNTSSILLAMESSDKSYSELEDYANALCERLRAIPDLAKASVMGKQQEEIAVTVDRDRLSAYGIDPSQLFLEYRGASLSVPAGIFSTDYTESAIHIASSVVSEREVAERIVYSDPSGNVVRLKDIARIERRSKAPSSFISYNGHPCLIVNIEMRPDHNIVAFGDEVDEVISSYSRDLPDSVKMSRICDQPKVVDRSVWSFLRDLLISMLVVVFVMLLLFPLRSALIASSGVPVCIGVSIAVMYMTGMPLNTVTLAALIVVLGMIVDDSIITMDGYMQHLSLGRKGVDAAATSAKELFMPTFIATLAICLMFFPMELIITGYLGDFIRLFPWIVLTALMTSLFYAVTVVPSLEVRFIGGVGEDRKTVIARAQDWFFSGLQKIYERCLEWCFRFHTLTIIGGIAAIALGVLMFSRINIQMMPKAARDFFVIELYAESGNGIEQTRARADSLERLLLSDSRVVSVTSFVGEGAPRFAATYTPILPSPRTAQIIVNTKSNQATEEMLREYPGRYEHIFPDARLRFKQMDYQAVDTPVAVRFSSADREQLVEPVSRVSAFLTSLQGETQWVHSDLDGLAPSVEITLDSDEASRLGVSKTLLSLSLAGTFGGETIATLWEGDRQVPVNIYSEGISPDMSYGTIEDQQVPTLLPGVSVPLRQVASVAPGWQYESLVRHGGVSVVTVGCDLKYGVSQPAVQKKLEDYVRSEIAPDLTEGVSYSMQGLSTLNNAVIPQIGWSFAAACLVLFLFLLVHFRKASVAVLTMVLSSLCLFGASFGLWIFGQDFSITAVLGLVSLVGIIVRNGILMFEYAEQLRSEGVAVREASLLSGKRRMRPIFLTSCTTALGVLPMILSGDLLWMPMGITICFGTMLSIFLITLIMPVSYWRLFKNADKK